MAFGALKRWWRSRQQREPASLVVEFDESEVRLRVRSAADKTSDQTFHWADITRVCFQDCGVLSSDLIFITLRSQERVIQIPTEARGGSEFFGELCDRGLLPERIWRKALGDTSGGMHCWPPFEQ